MHRCSTMVYIAAVQPPGIGGLTGDWVAWLGVVVIYSCCWWWVCKRSLFCLWKNIEGSLKNQKWRLRKSLFWSLLKYDHLWPLTSQSFATILSTCPLSRKLSASSRGPYFRLWANLFMEEPKNTCIKSPLPQTLVTKLFDKLNSQ